MIIHLRTIRLRLPTDYIADYSNNQLHNPDLVNVILNYVVDYSVDYVVRIIHIENNLCTAKELEAFVEIDSPASSMLIHTFSTYSILHGRNLLDLYIALIIQITILNYTT